MMIQEERNSYPKICITYIKGVANTPGQATDILGIERIIKNYYGTPRITTMNNCNYQIFFFYI